MNNTIVIPKTFKTPPYINKFPLGDENKTDWKGLDQYINYMFGENENDKLYALREVGNIFPDWVPINVYKPGDIPPYIPRKKNAVAVKYRGYDAWHYAGIMDEEERAAVTKYYDGGWIDIASKNAFKQYTGSFTDIKWMKYYDGTNWQTCFSLVPSGMMALFTSDPTGWTNRSTTTGSKFLIPSTTIGATGGGSHSHSSLNLPLNSTITPLYKYTSMGANRGTTHTHIAAVHTCNALGPDPSAAYYRMFQTPDNAGSHIPVGAICFWSGTTSNIPSNWSYISSNNGYYLKSVTTGVGNHVDESTAGHSSSGVAPPASTSAQSVGGPSSQQASNYNYNHNHNYNSSSHSIAHNHSSMTFPYFGVILMSADVNTGEFPVNGVTVFWNTPGTIFNTAWTRVSAADDLLLLAASSYGGTGGSLSHSHDHTNAYSSATYTGSSGSSGDVGTGYPYIGSSHSHLIQAATHSTVNALMPTSYNVYLYKRTA